MGFIASLKSHWRSAVVEGVAEADSEATLTLAKREYGTGQLMEAFVQYCGGVGRDVVKSYWRPIMGKAEDVDYALTLQRQIDLWEQRFAAKQGFWADGLVDGDVPV
eukprot:TRINITY_DN296_c0_g1_i8.p2 TRINITY_DN296_c0_g1~~TRINITY_DN296_c0_g1_i8.p2  ORF type:complete len:106 (-),score=20.83 TRINITY_DN296_c0_g1_i8:203-520(-)